MNLAVGFQTVKARTDGYNVMPAVNPTVLETFVEHVVPDLQRRGIFRRDYEGTTLRSHYDAEL